MTPQEYGKLDACDLVSMIRAGDVSRNEVADVARTTIQLLNRDLNFLAHWISADDTSHNSSARKDARFSGVPFLIKDAPLIGVPHEMGSRLCLGYKATVETELSRRIRNSGVTILGVSTMPEFGNAPTTEPKLYGPTRNPWNTGHSVGGSSGGAAAAVASGVVPLAQASDGGGSIRTPASCCGVVGLKPSRGRTPGSRVAPLSFGSYHVLSRSVRDSAAMLDELSGPQSGSAYYVPDPKVSFMEGLKHPNQSLRIAFSDTSPSGCDVHPDCKLAVKRTAEVCESLGHEVERVDLPFDWEPFIEAFLTLWALGYPFGTEARAKLSGAHIGEETLEATTMTTLQFGRNLTPADIGKALAYFDGLMVQVATFFEKYDVFLSPVTNRPAPLLGEINTDRSDLTAREYADICLSNYAAFAPLFNATGQPAISVPTYMGQAGLPVGVQLAAKFAGEDVLLGLASELEREFDWQCRIPPISACAL